MVSRWRRTSKKYLAKWVGMTFTADGDEVVHVDRQILLGDLKFAQHRASVFDTNVHKDLNIQGCGIVTHHIWMVAPNIKHLHLQEISCV